MLMSVFTFKPRALGLLSGRRMVVSMRFYGDQYIRKHD